MVRVQWSPVPYAETSFRTDGAYIVAQGEMPTPWGSVLVVKLSDGECRYEQDTMHRVLGMGAYRDPERTHALRKILRNA